jgi:hypothetical protein
MAAAVNREKVRDLVAVGAQLVEGCPRRSTAAGICPLRSTCR